MGGGGNHHGRCVRSCWHHRAGDGDHSRVGRDRSSGTGRHPDGTRPQAAGQAGRSVEEGAGATRLHINMTKAEAVSFLNSLTPAPVNMITLDPVKWTAFKALVVPLLADPTLDPKYKKALQDANVIVDAALG